MEVQFAPYADKEYFKKIKQGSLKRAIKSKDFSEAITSLNDEIIQEKTKIWLETYEERETYFTRMADKFKIWVDTYDTLLQQYAQTMQSSGQSSQILADIAKLTQDGYNLLETFQEDFNIYINYAVFFHTPKREIKKSLGSITFRILNSSSALKEARARWSQSNQKVISHIIVQNKTAIKNDIQQSYIDINIPIEQGAEKKTFRQIYLSKIQNHILKIAQSVSGTKGSMPAAGKELCHNFEDVTNFGRLGEGVLSTYLMSEHLDKLKELYDIFAADPNHTNLGDFRNLGGPKNRSSIIFKDLLSLLDPSDTLSFFTTGDFEYAQIWEVLHSHQLVLADLNQETDLYKTKHKDIKSVENVKYDTLTSKPIKTLYENYKNIRLQIKQPKADVKGQTIYNYCKALSKMLNDKEIFTKLSQSSYENLKKALENTRETSAEDYTKAFLQLLETLENV